MLEHFNLLCLMAGGRSKYTLTNVRCNETLPESNALTFKNHADAVQNLRKTLFASGLVTGSTEV